MSLRLQTSPLRRLLALDPVLRGRLALGLGAVSVGIVAWAFAGLADAASAAFLAFSAEWRWAPLFVTPAGFMLLAFLTHRFAPLAKGSGIPQVIAASRRAPAPAAAALLSWRTAAWKVLAATGALLVGASAGREGPTVQLSAAIMALWLRGAGLRLDSGLVIAGGAAGVAAAFNAPLAGVAFAIEELASAYEQKAALRVMAAIMLSGFVALTLGGDYVYFGAMVRGPGLLPLLPAVLAAGLLGGAGGALFSGALRRLSTARHGALGALRRRPVLLAGACGLVVAVVGLASGGLTWGTSYEPARALVEGHGSTLWFGPAKFAASLATAVSGIPGGIFAPSLAVGAGLGGAIAAMFPADQAGAIAVLGVTAYFVGVVRAPLTGIIIVSEMTDSHGLLLPMFAAALLADLVSSRIEPEKLYHALSREFG